MSEKKLQKEVLTNLIFHYFQGRANPIRRAGVLQYFNSDYIISSDLNWSKAPAGYLGLILIFY